MQGSLEGAEEAQKRFGFESLRSGYEGSRFGSGVWGSGLRV